MDGLLTLYRAVVAIRRSTRTITSPGVELRSSNAPDNSGRGVDDACHIGQYKDAKSGINLLQIPGSIARSFWRSQETTLMVRALGHKSGVLLDFGCGDGSLASAAYESVDYGVDIDPVALEVARKYGTYRNLLTFEEMKSIPPASVDCAVSCSVLEHTTDLPACLAALSRVLKPNGQLIFTVPSPGLTAQMTRLVDADFAESANEKMFHRNLFDRQTWRSLLSTAGFDVTVEQSFQPYWFTRLYFLLTAFNSKALGRLPLIEHVVFRLGRSKWSADVERSISQDWPDGANHFFVARKRDR